MLRNRTTLGMPLDPALGQERCDRASTEKSFSRHEDGRSDSSMGPDTTIGGTMEPPAIVLAGVLGLSFLESQGK